MNLLLISKIVVLPLFYFFYNKKDANFVSLILNVFIANFFLGVSSFMLSLLCRLSSITYTM